MKRALAVLSAILITSCGSSGDQATDIGLNPPPVEFQAGCLVLSQGAVVSLTSQPTLGVVVRTMSFKDHVSVRWEKVSDTSYIQRAEGRDPLTGNDFSTGLMFTKQDRNPTTACPNGFVLLERMVVNGEEQNQATMNSAFVSMINVAALNRPQQQQASAIEAAPPVDPAPEAEAGPPSDLDYCVRSASTDDAKAVCYDDEINLTIQMARADRVATEAEITGLIDKMDTDCPSSLGLLPQRQCQQRLAQNFNIMILERQGS
jgi:hypothetical protein